MSQEGDKTLDPPLAVILRPSPIGQSTEADGQVSDSKNPVELGRTVKGDVDVALDVRVADRPELPNASKAFLSLVEEIPKSRLVPTGLCLHSPRGYLFAIEEIQSDRVCISRKVLVKGPNVPKPLEFVIRFYLSITDDEYFLDEIEEDCLEYQRWKIFNDLANNPNLSNCIVFREGQPLPFFYIWNNREMAVLPSLTGRISLLRNAYYPDLEKTWLFDPATVTPTELNYSLCKLFDVQPNPEDMPVLEAIPSELQEFKISEGPVDEIGTDTLNQPKFVRTSIGIVAYGTDKGIGYKDWNEDGICVSDKGFVVFDGLGGHSGSQEATGLVSRVFQRGFRRNCSFIDMHSNAHKLLMRANLKKSGVCYMAGRIVGDNLNIGQAGDVKLMILDENGNIIFVTEDERGFLPNSVTNYLRGNPKKPGSPTSNEVKLKKGYRIVVGTDGIFDNIEPGQMAALIMGKSIQEAMQVANMYVKEKMAYARDCKVRGVDLPQNTKADNCTLFMFDITD